MEHLFEMDGLGLPPFWETSICYQQFKFSGFSCNMSMVGTDRLGDSLLATSSTPVACFVAWRSAELVMLMIFFQQPHDFIHTSTLW